MTLSKAIGTVTTIIIGIGAIAAAQDAAAPGFVVRIADTSPPGIDNGVRAADPPREPRPDANDRSNRSRSLPYLRGSIIVKFRAGTATTSKRAMLTRAGASAMSSPPYSDFDIVTIDDGADPEAAARQLAGQPDVEYAHARHYVDPMFVPNDPLYPLQWNYPALDMEHAWDLSAGASPSIIVAVIDSGIAFRNEVVAYRATAYTTEGGVRLPALGMVEVPFAAAPDLGGPNRFVAPHDFIWNNADPIDTDGHGTHVAGTIGQATNNALGGAGMAFNVRIMPVKVLTNAWDVIFNSPEKNTDDVAARGIRYAADNGAKVLNLSFGSIGGPSPVLRDALAYAVSRGAFVAISAGNEYERGNGTMWPAAYAPEIQGVVAVGAIGRDRLRAYYSSTGSYVELAAPGGSARVGGTPGEILQQTFDFGFTKTYEDVPSRYRAPRFDVFSDQFMQGTSMAAPHVAGLAALLMQQGITSPAAVEAAMEKFATDLGAGGRDDEYGYGLINPRATLRGLGLAK